MDLLAQVITSFIASAAFGILFNAPRQSLVKCGLIGMGGWVIYYILEEKNQDAVMATLIAAFFIGVVSNILAKVNKNPVIIFSVAGIIPLVPGGLAYDAMRRFVESNYDASLSLAARTLLLAGSIAFGLVFAEVINQIVKKLFRKSKKIKQI